MIQSQETRELLDAIAKVLLRCFALGVLLLVVWSGCVLLAGDLIHRISVPLLGLSRHEMNVIHYGGIVFVKCLALLFFLFPYIAIRLVLSNSKL
jgi:hypothetical protein